MAAKTVNVKIGIQPTGWTNDDFQEIGDDTPYQQILDQTKEAGYEGGSTGHNYPTHFPSLKHALDTRGLKVTSTWVGTKFTEENQFEPTLDEVRRQIAFLKALGSTDIVVAELAGAVNQVRTKAVLDDRPILNEAQWYLLATGLNEAGKLALDNKMRLSFHPHVGTCVQNRDEIDELFARTAPEYVSMCLDTGHAWFAGVDPVKLTLDYIERIKHVHLKNVRLKVLERAVPGKYSFYQAIREGIFTVPGDPAGEIDFVPIFAAFQKNNYEGWIVVEAEQDPSKAPKTPMEYAQMARKFIREHLGC